MANKKKFVSQLKPTGNKRYFVVIGLYVKIISLQLQ